MKKISILIPVYNEVSTLETMVKKVEETDFCGLEKEIILIDDGSTDGTKDLYSKFSNHKVFFHEKNLGKGAAFKMLRVTLLLFRTQIWSMILLIMRL